MAFFSIKSVPAQRINYNDNIGYFTELFYELPIAQAQRLENLDFIDTVQVANGRTLIDINEREYGLDPSGITESIETIIRLEENRHNEETFNSILPLEKIFLKASDGVLVSCQAEMRRTNIGNEYVMVCVPA